MKLRYLGLGLLLILAACGSDSGGGESVEGVAVVVDMFDNRYQFTDIRIPVGGSVTWVGAGANPHNSVDANEAWSTESDWGDLDQYEGDEATLTYNTAGEYIFYCTYHGNADGDGMAGTLTVGDG